jgi:hypothetical protein
VVGNQPSFHPINQLPNYLDEEADKWQNP